MTTSQELLKAFMRVRQAAESHMDARDSAGLGWAEESVTDASAHHGLPEVKMVQFTRHQEGRGVGADYLWWWLSRSTAECFGMLVQAKRLKKTGGNWTVDVRHRDGQQFRDLLKTADFLGVPALYAIYTGGRVFRRDLPCRHGGQPNCLPCRRMAISLISAYQLSVVGSPRDTAALVLQESTALEDLVDPALPPEGCLTST